LENGHGREVKTTGDGFLATFESPSQAIRSARSMIESLATIGLAIRIGLHTGECQVVEGDLTGIALHAAARVCSEAGAGEVIVSSAVRDLVAGAGIQLVDRGEFELKGVPGQWRLYSA
jgi:class 3 adenylate cyclase